MSTIAAIVTVVGCLLASEVWRWWLDQQDGEQL